MRPRLVKLDPIKYSIKQLLEKDLLIFASACKHQIPNDKQNLQDIIADHLKKKNKSVGDLGLFSERSNNHTRLRKRSISPIRFADRDASNYHFNDSYHNMSPLQHYSMSSSLTTDRHANKTNYYREDKNNQYQDHGYFSRSGRKTDTEMQPGRYDRRKARPDVFSPSNSKSAKRYVLSPERRSHSSQSKSHAHSPSQIYPNARQQATPVHTYQSSAAFSHHHSEQRHIGDEFIIRSSVQRRSGSSEDKIETNPQDHSFGPSPEKRAKRAKKTTKPAKEDKGLLFRGGFLRSLNVSKDSIEDKIQINSQYHTFKPSSNRKAEKSRQMNASSSDDYSFVTSTPLWDNAADGPAYGTGKQRDADFDADSSWAPDKRLPKSLLESFKHKQK